MQTSRQFDTADSVDVQRYMNYLPTGSAASVTWWTLVTLIASPVLAPLGWLLELLGAEVGLRMYVAAFVYWRMCRISWLVRGVKKHLADAAHAELLHALCGGVDPDAYGRAKMESISKAKMATSRLALYLRHVDPGFLGPRWQSDPSDWPMN